VEGTFLSPSQAAGVRERKGKRGKRGGKGGGGDTTVPRRFSLISERLGEEKGGGNGGTLVRLITFVYGGRRGGGKRTRAVLRWLNGGGKSFLSRQPWRRGEGKEGEGGQERAGDGAVSYSRYRYKRGTTGLEDRSDDQPGSDVLEGKGRASWISFRGTRRGKGGIRARGYPVRLEKGGKKGRGDDSAHAFLLLGWGNSRGSLLFYEEEKGGKGEGKTIPMILYPALERCGQLERLYSLAGRWKEEGGRKRGRLSLLLRHS